MKASADDKKDYPVETPEGTIIAKKSTEDPIEQKFTSLTDEQRDSIKAWELAAHSFVKAYLGDDAEVSLKSCDEAFFAWQREENKRFTDSQVISYLGAYLGQKCVEDLEMEWKIITDEYGSDYAVEYTKGLVHAFPLSSVAKRVEANTHEFMYPVFYAIKQNIKDGDYKRK